MDRARTLIVGASGAFGLLLLGAAAQPAVLAAVSPGLWEISGKPQTKPERICLGDVANLAVIEHSGIRCTRVVIRDLPTLAEIHYTCTGGGFGRTTLTLITPRSVRVDTQGISGGGPFSYVVQARRVGDCPK